MIDLFSILNDFSDTDVPPIDLHLHTNWTDGKNTVEAMYDQAQKVGLEVILFSEHARASSGDWFPKFARQVRELPKTSCHALVGVEAKVKDFNGNLDCTNEIIDLCDLVMGSVHRFPGEQGEIMQNKAGLQPDEALKIEFKLANALLENPLVDILGHPFGMCFSRFGITPPDKMVLALIEKASQSDTAFEINSRYHPDPRKFINWCSDLGAKFSLGSNAHDLEQVGEIARLLKEQESV